MCVGKAESNLTQVGTQLRECLSAKECAVRCGAVSVQRGMSEAQRGFKVLGFNWGVGDQVWRDCGRYRRSYILLGSCTAKGDVRILGMSQCKVKGRAYSEGDASYL